MIPPEPDPDPPTPPVPTELAANLSVDVLYYADWLSGPILKLDSPIPSIVSAKRVCMLFYPETSSVYLEIDLEGASTEHTNINGNIYALTPYFYNNNGYVGIGCCYDLTNAHGFYEWNGSTWVYNSNLGGSDCEPLGGVAAAWMLHCQDIGINYNEVLSCYGKEISS